MPVIDGVQRLLSRCSAYTEAQVLEECDADEAWSP